MDFKFNNKIYTGKYQQFDKGNLIIEISQTDYTHLSNIFRNTVDPKALLTSNNLSNIPKEFHSRINNVIVNQIPLLIKCVGSSEPCSIGIEI